MLELKTKDTVYVIGFTRATVRQMEKEGFVASDIERKPMTVVPDFFAGAFKANHRFIKREVIDSIYEKIKGKDALISALTDEYNATLSSLFDEPDDDSEGNVAWTKVN